MKRILQEARSELRSIKLPQPSHPHHHDPSPIPQISNPKPCDIYRYRYHHGTNLGSIYVLERWLFPSMFPDLPGDKTSELEAVKAWVNTLGIEETKKKFEQHWADAVSDEDLRWLKDNVNCTAIRLPIGYFSLSQRQLLKRTPFEPHAKVYESAWSSILALIRRLQNHHIGVLLDLHALPGGANGNEHSGTNSGEAALWISNRYQQLGVECCRFLAEQVHKEHLINVTGIQIVNEAEHQNDGRMYWWYDDCINAISQIAPDIPVYISDGWNLGTAVQYALRKNNPFIRRHRCPIIIDTHLYWAYSDADKNRSPGEIISDVAIRLWELDGAEGDVVNRGAVQVIVGEYSCCLSEESWCKCDPHRDEMRRQFGRAQCKKYQERAGGAFFWTWKMEWMPGGEWGFQAQAFDSLPPAIIPQVPVHPEDIQRIIETATCQRDKLCQTACAEHQQYWHSTNPGMKFEHDKYDYGWKVGFEDALCFFQGGEGCIGPGNRIGCLEMWVLKRIRECRMTGDFVWEFEHGLRKGIKDFNMLAFA